MKFSMLTRVVFLLILTSQSLLLTACFKPKNPYCCCATEGGGTGHWPKGYGACSEESGINCVSGIIEYDAKTEQCPFQNNGALEWSPFMPRIKTEIMLASSKSVPLEIQPVEKELNALKPVYERSCQGECNDPDSPFCLLIDKANSPELSGQLDKLSKLIINNDTVVNKDDIMKIFKVKQDPCLRGNTDTNNNNILSNNGEACVFKTKFEFAGASKKLLNIHIPKLLKGKLNTDDGVKVVFAERENAGLLKIDSHLDKDFGGHIHTIAFSKNEFIIGTERGCLALK